MRRIRWIAAVLGAAVVGYIARWISPHHGLRDLRNSKALEQQRVTDPFGRFDAVLLLEGHGGALGEMNWFVTVVPNGKPPSNSEEAVLAASDVLDAHLAWREPHVLEFAYQRAMILDFTNVWFSNTPRNSATSADRKPYTVEIRLAPSGPNW